MDSHLDVGGYDFKDSLGIQMCKFDLMTVQGRSIEFTVL